MISPKASENHQGH